jgi:hypothetical protein
MSSFDFLDPFSPAFELDRGRADITVFGDRRLHQPQLDTSLEPLARVYENEDDQMVAYAFSHACLGVC